MLRSVDSLYLFDSYISVCVQQTISVEPVFASQYDISKPFTVYRNFGRGYYVDEIAVFIKVLFSNNRVSGKRV